MSPLIFYREQAARQKVEAEAATLQNVRERCQRASDAWTALAARSERGDDARRQAAVDKLLGKPGEDAGAGFDEVEPLKDDD
jgi:hypothetical protein